MNRYAFFIFLTRADADLKSHKEFMTLYIYTIVGVSVRLKYQGKKCYITFEKRVSSFI